MSAPRCEVFLLSSVPPPTGGIAVWTKRFLEAAPRHGVTVQFRDIGLRNESELFHRGPAVHLRRAFRDLIQPLASVVLRRPAIVHVCVSSGSSFLVGLAYATTGAICRIPTIVHVHGSFAQCSGRAIALARRLSTSARVLFATPSASDAHTLEFPVQVDNFVPRAAVRRRAPAVAGRLRLVALGWMTRAKGIFELTEAVAGLDGVTLDLYGPVVRQSELDEWHALRDRLAAGTSVRYRGTLEETEMLHTLADYDALVVASHAESFGMAAAEAMMNEVPLIATRTGFVAALPEECFTPLPASDAAGIRRVLEEAVARPGMLEAKTAAAHRFASSRLSEDAAFSRWLTLYDRVSGAAPSESRRATAGAVSGH